MLMARVAASSPKRDVPTDTGALTGTGGVATITGRTREGDIKLEL
ncbi:MULTISPECIES: hypothetical protein [Actinotignum]|uniref:Uncharacterized protein n=1 Tax=Actinotignum timonense TaxID=1870995 RepID=A0AAW9HMA1_9ACTO|nr:hypothetical protein [Actinotignum timonense]MDY5130885.1 hypothetical protein [Actinotignum timonense]MDY5140577.1 hypothetical protein [Actinotignum timonense]